MISNQRNYNFADTILVERGGIMIKFLEEDIERFSAKDATYNHEKLEKIKAIQLRAENVKSDDIVLAEQIKVTAHINAMMIEAGKMHKEMLCFAKKLFGAKSPHLREFGMNKFQYVKNSQPKLITYMEELSQSVESNRVGLKNQGALDARLDEVIAFSELFKEANKHQLNQKKYRIESSICRVNVYNELFENLKEIKAAVAKMVFPVGSKNIMRYQINNTEITAENAT